MFHLQNLCSHRRCFAKKVFLKISQNSQENTWQSLYFDKVAALKPSTLLKQRLWHMCFLSNFAKYSRTLFLGNTSGRLLAHVNFRSQIFVLEAVSVRKMCKKFWQSSLVLVSIPKIFLLTVGLEIQSRNIRPSNINKFMYRSSYAYYVLSFVMIYFVNAKSLLFGTMT